MEFTSKIQLLENKGWWKGKASQKDMPLITQQLPPQEMMKRDVMKSTVLQA